VPLVPVIVATNVANITPKIQLHRNAKDLHFNSPIHAILKQPYPRLRRQMQIPILAFQCIHCLELENKFFLIFFNNWEKHLILLLHDCLKLKMTIYLIVFQLFVDLKEFVAITPTTKMKKIQNFSAKHSLNLNDIYILCFCAL
jgi:hypothetical protein